MPCFIHGLGRRQLAGRRIEPGVASVGGREGGPRRAAWCLDLESWRCRGNSRASVTSFVHVAIPIWVCCCDAAVAEIMSHSMLMSHSPVTDATFPRRRGPETVALLILPRSLHFPAFALLIPPPDLSLCHGLLLPLLLHHRWPPLPSLCQPKSPGHKGQVHHQQRSKGLHVSRSFPFSHPCSHPRSPVYEYPLNGQWIMMDIDDGYILWTGIWKGMSHALSPPPVLIAVHSTRQLQRLAPPPNVPSSPFSPFQPTSSK